LFCGGIAPADVLGISSAVFQIQAVRDIQKGYKPICLKQVNRIIVLPSMIEK